ncbi:hypothetical protein BS47DRAFT_1363031 [Hydnum rufescens UP504]|uniref:Uncharacterized protein n=1 Tax=Hydnum rufescens UP504 TaxID=1448309 RepID=A0A9P6DWC9_9AGAM|nr:hypothetical protein BS47DRAFT_1363031 [Hydnum rufescens UP504]
MTQTHRAEPHDPKPTKPSQTPPHEVKVFFPLAMIVQEEQPLAVLLGRMGAPGAPGLLEGLLGGPLIVLQGPLGAPWLANQAVPTLDQRGKMQHTRYAHVDAHGMPNLLSTSINYHTTGPKLLE